MFHRAPGGIGASSFPSRVWPGQHFPGHMGHERKTSKNLRVVKIDVDENLLLVRGAVAGPAGSVHLDSQGTSSGQVKRKTTMPVVDVKNLEGKTVGKIELADDVFGAKVNQNLLHETVRRYLRGTRTRNAQDQGQERSERLGPEALEAEGNGPGAHRLDPFTALAPRRHRPRAHAAQLRLRAAEEDDCWVRCARRFRRNLRSRS